MATIPGSHAAFLAAAFATHALVGYTVGVLLAGRPRAGIVGGLAADVDLLFPAALGWPLVHRGLTHAVLAAVVATAVVLSWRRTAGVAFGGGYASHLLVDATTAGGVPLLYPLVSRPIHLRLPVGGHSVTATLLLWCGCLAVLYADGRLPARSEDA